MCQECRERFPHHRLQRKLLVSDPGRDHGTCITHVLWRMLGSLTCSGGENVPGIPVVCTTVNFRYPTRGPCFVPPNFRSELSSAKLWFVELACHANVTNVRNPDVNNYAVIQRQYRTFDVIKSIAIECVRAQQGVCGSKYNSWRGNEFTEQ